MIDHQAGQENAPSDIFGSHPHVVTPFTESPSLLSWKLGATLFSDTSLSATTALFCTVPDRKWDENLRSKCFGDPDKALKSQCGSTSRVILPQLRAWFEFEIKSGPSVVFRSTFLLSASSAVNVWIWTDSSVLCNLPCSERLDSISICQPIQQHEWSRIRGCWVCWLCTSHGISFEHTCSVRGASSHVICHWRSVSGCNGLHVSNLKRCLDHAPTACTACPQSGLDKK